MASHSAKERMGKSVNLTMTAILTPSVKMLAVVESWGNSAPRHPCALRERA